MSLLTSLYSGYTGMQCHSNALSTVGDNLANSNTIGFKRGMVTFHDLLNRSYAELRPAAATNNPAASTVARTFANFTQGSLQATDGPSDLAIEGTGFFVIHDAAADNSYYTRAGDFKWIADETELTTLDQSDNTYLTSDNFTDYISKTHLSTTDGLFVRGFAITDGVTATELSNVTLDLSLNSVQATSEVEVEVMLESDAPLYTSKEYDPNNPYTYNFSSSVTIYDSLGYGHELTLQFRRTDDLSWDWHALANADELADAGGATSGLVAIDQLNGKSTNLVFHDYGDLDLESFTNDIGSISWAANSTTGETPATQTINFDFLGPELGFGYATEGSRLGNESVMLNLSQDGLEKGFLSGVEVDYYGKVNANFSNGATKPLYQLALARFASTAGLEREGGNKFSATEYSGTAMVGNAAADGFGFVRSRYLEASNVDMSTDMINMISYQRAYQANATSLRTANEMMMELKNL